MNQNSQTSEKMERDFIAIFWDYENIRVIAEGINVPLADAILSYSHSLGHPFIKRVYGNWAMPTQKITQALYSLGFDPIQVSMGKTNSVDVKLAVDCLDAAVVHNHLKIFIIITGDKDFIPVVNWLKAHEKKVIIISKPETVSEHLLMSADDFISLKELSEKYTQLDVQAKERNETLEAKAEKLTSFDDAVNYLIQTIEKIRDDGKSTRLAVVDNYLRSSHDFEYHGARRVELPDKSGTFKSFSNFIDEVVKIGKVKTETIEGFKEIFLIEENPMEESEFSKDAPEKIDLKHWEIIIENVIKMIKKKEEKSEKVYKSNILDDLKKLRNKNKLPSNYYNRVLRNALNVLIDIRFMEILPQQGGKIELADDYDKNRKKYMKKAFENQ